MVFGSAYRTCPSQEWLIHLNTVQALLAPCIRLPILESSYANPFQWHIEQISSYSKRNAESEMMSRNAEGEMMSRNLINVIQVHSDNNIQVLTATTNFKFIQVLTATTNLAFISYGLYNLTN